MKNAKCTWGPGEKTECAAQETVWRAANPNERSG